MTKCVRLKLQPDRRVRLARLYIARTVLPTAIHRIIMHHIIAITHIEHLIEHHVHLIDFVIDFVTIVIHMPSAPYLYILMICKDFQKR